MHDESISIQTLLGSDYSYLAGFYISKRYQCNRLANRNSDSACSIKLLITFQHGLKQSCAIVYFQFMSRDLAKSNRLLFEQARRLSILNLTPPFNLNLTRTFAQTEPQKQTNNNFAPIFTHQINFCQTSNYLRIPKPIVIYHLSIIRTFHFCKNILSPLFASRGLLTGQFEKNDISFFGYCHFSTH